MSGFTRRNQRAVVWPRVCTPCCRVRRRWWLHKERRAALARAHHSLGLLSRERSQAPARAWSPGGAPAPPRPPHLPMPVVWNRRSGLVVNTRSPKSMNSGKRGCSVVAYLPSCLITGCAAWVDEGVGGEGGRCDGVLLRARGSSCMPPFRGCAPAVSAAACLSAPRLLGVPRLPRRTVDARCSPTCPPTRPPTCGPCWSHTATSMLLAAVGSPTASLSAPAGTDMLQGVFGAERRTTAWGGRWGEGGRSGGCGCVGCRPWVSRIFGKER